MFRIAVMTAAAVITVSAAHAQSQSTLSLGEIARQTAEKRATGKPATKVLTNADLKPAPGETAEAAPAAAEAPSTDGYVSKSTGEVLTAEEMLAASKEKLVRDNSKMDEKYWRNQAASLRNEIERTKERVAAQRTAQPRTEAMKQIAAKELVKQEKVLAGLEKQWSQLQEAAEYAGIPKHWLDPQ